MEEPQRVKIEGKRGLHVVYKGGIIEELGWCKNTKVYYAIGTKPRKWFTRDFSHSYFLFTQFKNKDDKYSTIPKPKHNKSLKAKAKITFTDEFANALETAGVNIADLIEGISIEDADVPEKEIWNRARELIYTNQVEASRKIGIPELAYIESISPLPNSLTLKKIGEMYCNRENKPLSKGEKDDTERWWADFCRIVEVDTIREVTEEHIKKYHKIITKMASSDVYQKHRLKKLKTVLYYAKREESFKDDINRVLEYTDYFKGKYLDSNPSNPTPISREIFFKIYNVADEQYKLIMLISANCGFTPVDIEDLQWSMLDLKRGTLQMRRKKRGRVLRIAVLWKRIIKQLKQLQQMQTDSKYVFLNSGGKPYTAGAVSSKWSRLRAKAKIKQTQQEPATFESLRDTAQTEPSATCLDQNIDCLMGHSCGISDRYKLRDPKKLVGKVCNVLENYYFPGTNKK